MHLALVPSSVLACIAARALWFSITSELRDIGIISVFFSLCVFVHYGTLGYRHLVMERRKSIQ